MELQFEQMTDEMSVQLQNLCQGMMPAGEIKVHPSSTVLTKAYQECAQEILDMEIREDDVWVITFPKCGTTWTQEMVWLLKNHLDFKKAKTMPLTERFPFLEYTPLCNDSYLVQKDTIKVVKTMKSPRFIKTHLPEQLLPKQIWTKNPKIIYVFRNPKDAAISYFHHFRLWNNYQGSQDLFLKAFIEDKVVFSPFWEHVLSYWKHRHEPNFIFNTFEEMKQNLSAVLKRTAAFLETKYNEDEEHLLLDHLSFSSMKNNKAVNAEDFIHTLDGKKGMAFFRQGEAGAWKKELSPEFSKLFEDWTSEKLKGTDFPAPY